MPKKPVPEDLEQPEQWDLEHGIRLPGRREGRRTVVSVAFSSRDFQEVARGAEAAGKRVSEFIREAALRAARGDKQQLAVQWSSVSGAALFQVQELAPITGGGRDLARPIEWGSPPDR